MKICVAQILYNICTLFAFQKINNLKIIKIFFYCIVDLLLIKRNQRILTFSEMSDNAGSIGQSPNGDIEIKFVDAKAYLQTTSTKSGDNL